MPCEKLPDSEDQQKKDDVEYNDHGACRYIQDKRKQDSAKNRHDGQINASFHGKADLPDDLRSIVTKR
jgi:hypothetical protein